MSFFRNLKHRLYAFKHADLNPDNFPIDAWEQHGFNEWFQRHQATETELEAQRKRPFTHGTTFSIIVPLFKTPLSFLRAMVQSVQAQTYAAWELVLVNASPDDADLGAEVAALAAQDKRIAVVSLQENLGITLNTFAGITAATGAFVCFLDHDDFLEPNALYEYALALEGAPEIDVFYSDECLVEERAGALMRLHPYFKPDYAPEKLLSTNYAIHFLGVRRTLALEAPEPSALFDGTQDYNLLLFSCEHARTVHHVPKMLYNWRICEGSTAANPDAKPYDRMASRRSIEAHIQRMQIPASIVGSGIVNTQNLWFAADAPPLVSVIVWGSEDAQFAAFAENFNQVNTYAGVEVLHAQTPANADHSLGAPNTQAAVAAFPFAALNAAATRAQGEVLLFLPASSFFATPEPVQQLLGLLQVEGVGVVAPKVLYADRSVRGYGIAVTPARIMPLYRGYPHDFPAYQCNLRAFQNASAAALEGLMVRRADFLHVGGFDDAFASEVGTAEFCHRVRQRGVRVALTPTVELQTNVACPQPRYDCSQNAPDFSPNDVKAFDAKWPGVRAQGDPFFNGNLNQGSSYFQFGS